MSIKYDTIYDELYAIELLKGSFLSNVEKFTKSESPDWVSGDGRIGVEVTRVQFKEEGKLNALWNKNVGKERKDIKRNELDALKRNSFFLENRLRGYGIIQDVPTLKNKAVATYLRKEEKLNSNFTIFQSNRLFLFISCAFDDKDISEIARLILERRKQDNVKFDIIYILNDDQFYVIELRDFDIGMGKLLLKSENMKELKSIAGARRNEHEWKNGDVYK